MISPNKGPVDLLMCEVVLVVTWYTVVSCIQTAWILDEQVWTPENARVHAMAIGVGCSTL